MKRRSYVLYVLPHSRNDHERNFLAIIILPSSEFYRAIIELKVEPVIPAAINVPVI